MFVISLNDDWERYKRDYERRWWMREELEKERKLNVVFINNIITALKIGFFMFNGIIIIDRLFSGRLRLI